MTSSGVDELNGEMVPSCPQKFAPQQRTAPVLSRHV